MNILFDRPHCFMLCSSCPPFNLPGSNPMKWMFVAACAVIAAGLWMPGHAAQPTTPTETQAALPAGTDDPITFDQYREWRLRFIERRQTQLAAQLAAAELQPRQRVRPAKTKAYYAWFAGLSEAERARRFRERFDQMDSNHDGIVDPAERAAWHDK